MTKVKKVVVPQQPTKSTKINNPVTVQSTNINIGQKTNIDISSRAAELGITVEQYNILCAKDEVFAYAYNDIKYQKQVVEQHINSTAITTSTTAKQTPSQTVIAGDASNASEPVAQNLQAQAAQVEVESEESIDDSLRSENYNFRAFDKLDDSEKYQVLFTELARNHYLYGDQNNIKTPEDWKNLSEEEKNNLIYDAGEMFSEENKEFYERIFSLIKKDENGSPNAISELANNNALFHLENVLLANRLNMSVSDYEKRSLDDKIMDFNDAYSLDLNTENLTALQIKKLEENRDLTRAWGYFLATEGNQPDNEYWYCVQQNLNNALDFSCLKEQIAEYNKKNGTKISYTDIKESYMKYQLDNNLIPDEEVESFKEKYEQIEKYNDSSLKIVIDSNDLKKLVENDKIKLPTPPLLERMKNTYGQDFSSATMEQKFVTISKFLDDELGKTSNVDEQAEIVSNLSCELLIENSDNGLLVGAIYGAIVKNGSEDLQTALAGKFDTISASLNSLNVRSFGKNKKALKNFQSACCKVCEQGASLAIEAMKNATNEQNLILSEGFANFNDEKVQNFHMNTAYNINNENPDIAVQMLNNTAQYSADSVRADATKRVGELDKKHEIPVLEALTKDCSLATATAIEYDVPSTLDIENQIEAVELLGDNVQVQFEDEDVDKYLSTLADNIKNLDKSVQQEALDYVYETGNQVAIEKATENLIAPQTPQIIQEAELPRVFERVVISKALSDSDLAGLDLTKQLSSSQVSSLPPQEKQKYYINMFVKASANDKIKFLEKLPNGTQKKVVFTIIARFAPRLLETMVDAGMGPQMLASNLPFDASNKVLKAMMHSGNSDVQKQIADLISDKDYHERIQNFGGARLDAVFEQKKDKELAESSYMSMPKDFMHNYGVTPEEMQRMQKSLWYLDKAGVYNA